MSCNEPKRSWMHAVVEDSAIVMAVFFSFKVTESCYQLSPMIFSGISSSFNLYQSHLPKLSELSVHLPRCFDLITISGSLAWITG